MSSRKNPVRTKRRAHVQQYSTGQAQNPPVPLLSATSEAHLVSAAEVPPIGQKPGPKLPPLSLQQLSIPQTPKFPSKTDHLPLDQPAVSSRSGDFYIDHSTPNASTLLDQAGYQGKDVVVNVTLNHNSQALHSNTQRGVDVSSQHGIRNPTQPQRAEQPQWEDNWDEEADWNAQDDWDPEQQAGKEEKWDDEWEKKEEWNNEEEWQGQWDEEAGETQAETPEGHSMAGEQLGKVSAETSADFPVLTEPFGQRQGVSAYQTTTEQNDEEQDQNAYNEQYGAQNHHFSSVQAQNSRNSSYGTDEGEYFQHDSESQQPKQEVEGSEHENEYEHEELNHQTERNPYGHENEQTESFHEEENYNEDQKLADFGHDPETNEFQSWNQPSQEYGEQYEQDEVAQVGQDQHDEDFNEQIQGDEHDFEGQRTGIEKPQPEESQASHFQPIQDIESEHWEPQGQDGQEDWNNYEENPYEPEQKLDGQEQWDYQEKWNQDGQNYEQNELAPNENAQHGIPEQPVLDFQFPRTPEPTGAEETEEYQHGAQGVQEQTENQDDTAAQIEQHEFERDEILEDEFLEDEILEDEILEEEQNGSVSQTEADLAAGVHDKEPEEPVWDQNEPESEFFNELNADAGVTMNNSLWETEDHEDLVVRHQKPLQGEEEQLEQNQTAAKLKLAALELLDLDDDLLLDDDFLDDYTEDLEADDEAEQMNEQKIDAWNEQANMYQLLPQEQLPAPAPAPAAKKSLKYQPAESVPKPQPPIPGQAPKRQAHVPQAQPQGLSGPHVLPVKPALPFLPVHPSHAQTPNVAQSVNPKAQNSKYASKYLKPAELPTKPHTSVAGVVAPGPQFAQVQREEPVVNKAEAEMKKKLDAAKKKNDAYDFPLALAQPPKPALRVASTQVIPKGPLTSSTGSSNTPMLPGRSAAAPGEPINASNRSFFEELPDTVPKPSQRPVRAAAAVPIPAAPPVQEPPAPSQPPISKKKLPKNPYAQLAPKAKVLPMLSKPQMGTVPMSAPTGNAPMGNIPMAQPNHLPASGNASVAPNKYQPAQGPPGMAPGVTPGITPPVGPPGQAHPGQVPPNAGFAQNLAQVQPGIIPPAGIVPPAQNAYAPQAPAPGPGHAPQQNHYQRNYQPGPAPPPLSPAMRQGRFSPGPNQASMYAPQGGHTQAGPPQSGYAGPSQPGAPPQGFQQPGAPQPGAPPVPVQGGFAAPQPGAPRAQGLGVSQPGHVASASVPFPSVQASSPPRVNTNLSKSTEKSSLSPYVPHSGPYAPSAANRGHSRTSSIMGGKGKEGNPYAINPVGANAGPGQQNAASAMKLPVARPHARSFGKQNGVKKITNPAALLQRQFPIFQWGNSQNVVHLIPAAPSTFGPTAQSIKILKLLTLTPSLELLAEFPGPLTKVKSKKAIEIWLEKNITKQMNNFTDETLLCQVLLALVQHDGNFTAQALHKDLASILTPTVDFAQDQKVAPNFLGSSGLATNAYKLDATGVNSVWLMIQAGNREAALSFAVSKQDWALSLVVAHSIGPEKFAKIASDYARMMFPFQRSQNTKVQHLMPIVMKIFAGYAKGPIEDFLNVPCEAEFAKSHYREIISAAVINEAPSEFLVEYGKFLADANLLFASELCFVIAGIIVSKNPLQNGATFSHVGSLTVSSVYSEIYEYVLLTSLITGNAIPPFGLPHLIQNKIATAELLADLGSFSAARRYCDHISVVLKTMGKSPLVKPSAIADFQNLVVRISDSNVDNSGWLGSKLSKVNLWGHIDKFIGGEDQTPKPNENGVFSKFSPSISRNTSALDVTQIANSLPLYRPELQPLNSFIGGPPSEFSSPQHNRAQPLRYAPGGPSQSLKFGSQIAAPGYGFAKNGSQTHLDERPKQRKRVSVNPGTASTTGTPGVPAPVYANKTAHLSSLSIASQGSQPPSFTAPPTAGVKRGSFGEGKAEAFHSRKNSKTHSRMSSLHSEASEISEKDTRKPETIAEWSEGSNSALKLNEGAQERFEQGKPQLQGQGLVPEHNKAVEEPEDNLDEKSQEENHDERIQEEEFQEEKFQEEEIPQKLQDQIPEFQREERNSSEHPAEKAPEPISDDAVPTTEGNDSSPPEAESKPEEPVETTEPKQTPAAPPKRTAPKRANPYAPGGSRSVSKGSNKYGPPGGNASRYASTNAHPMPEITGVNMFDYDKKDSIDQAKEPEKAEPEKPEDAKAQETAPPQEKVQEPASSPVSLPAHPPVAAKPAPLPAKIAPGPRRAPRKANAYAPAPKLSAANVDISFDYDADDNVVESPAAHKPVSLVLNTHNSPSLPGKDRFSNPFQGEGRDSGLRIHNGLDEFPIPGSPETTTRANSVVGNHLYSSRLSQSHQTDMYQQYEVKDDTVHDYIPVEEDEEDEEETQARLEAAKKKKEQELQKKEKEELVSRSGQVSRGSAHTTLSGTKWFSGILKLSDDKPKPIRAKMGQKMTFKYDEELKRWIDTSRPLEEQLQEATPPPPPKKKTAAKPESGETNPPKAENGPAAVTPAASAPGAPARKPRARPTNATDLANAGLDDLLSLSGANLAAPRKSKRRYVNVMDKK